jgi:hypothetical protein
MNGQIGDGTKDKTDTACAIKALEDLETRDGRGVMWEERVSVPNQAGQQGKSKANAKGILK